MPMPSPGMRNEDRVNNHFDEQTQTIDGMPARTAPTPSFENGVVKKVEEEGR